MTIKDTIRNSTNANKINPLVWVLFVVFVIFDRVVTQLFNLTASRLSGILLISPVVLMIIITILKNKGVLKFKITYYEVYILFFGIYCLLSSLWANSSSLAVSKAVDIIETFTIMVMISMCFQKKDAIDSILKALMYGYYIVIAYEIVFYGWSYFLLIMQDSTRISSEFINSNILGMSAAFAIVINLYLIVSNKVQKWTLAFVAFAVIVISASGSRKAFLSLVLGVFLFFLFRSLSENQKKNHFLKFWIALPLIIIVGYQILQLPMFSGIMERINGLLSAVTGGNGDKSSLIRFSLIQLGFDLFKENPFVGIGIDNAQLYTYSVVGETYYLHNNFVEILSCGGIIGFLIYYWIYIKLLASYTKRRRFSDLQFCICFTLLILMLVLDYGMVSYYSKATYIFLLLFVLFEEKLKKRSET